MGHLKWSPAEFWEATPHDLFAAWDGHLESIGQGRRGNSVLDAEDVARLRAMLE